MFSKSIKFLAIALMWLMISACGKSKEQEVKDAVTSANILLSTSQCQAAIDVLEGLGRQPRDADYLKTLASAYACRAGYSTTVLFGTDISKTASPAPLGGMTTYTTSKVTATSPLTKDSNFRDLQTAIDILLYAGGIDSTTEPTTIERAKYFSAGQAADINSEVAFMMLAQLGKLMRVYADTNSAGVKGGGSGSNTCFTDYTTTSATVRAALGIGNTGVCTTSNSSNTELALGVSNRRKRLCEGTVLLNNILHVLPSVLASAGGGSLSTIATMSQTIEDQKTALEAIDSTFTPTAVVLSQTNCESDSDITEITLSSYYAIFFEALVH